MWEGAKRASGTSLQAQTLCEFTIDPEQLRNLLISEDLQHALQSLFALGVNLAVLLSPVFCDGQVDDAPIVVIPTTNNEPPFDESIGYPRDATGGNEQRPRNSRWLLRTFAAQDIEKGCFAQCETAGVVTRPVLGP